MRIAGGGSSSELGVKCYRNFVWTADFRCGKFLKHTLGLWEIQKDIEYMQIMIRYNYIRYLCHVAEGNIFKIM